MEQITCMDQEADVEDKPLADSHAFEEGAGSLEAGEGAEAGSLEQQEGVGAQMVVHTPEEDIQLEQGSAD